MKSQLMILLVAVVLVQAKKHHKKVIEWDKITDAAMLNQMIRNRGTFIYQLLNVIQDKEQALEVRKNIDKMDSPKYEDKATQSVYSSPQIELPAICNKNWSPQTLVDVLEKGEEFINKWLEGTPLAGKANKEVFNKMPMLSAEQFSKFYAFMVEGVTVFDKEVDNRKVLFFNAEEAQKDAKVLMSEANFDLYQKFDAIPWLQFWVYMCSEGKVPKLQEYLSNTDLRPGHKGPAVAKSGILGGKSPSEQVPVDVKTPTKPSSAGDVAKAAEPKSETKSVPEVTPPKKEEPKKEEPKKEEPKARRLVNVLSTVAHKSVAQRRLLKQRAAHQKKNSKVMLAKQKSHQA